MKSLWNKGIKTIFKEKISYKTTPFPPLNMLSWNCQYDGIGYRGIFYINEK